MANANHLPFTPLTGLAQPVSPDFSLCHPFYGEHLIVTDCLLAAGRLPAGGEMVEYSYTSTGYQPYDIPLVSSQGTCQIRVSYAYVDALGDLLNAGLHVIPNLVRNLAGWLLHDCVSESGVGGFGTIGIANMFAFLTDDTTTMNLIGNGPWPAHAAFLTVTVSRTDQGPNEDPGLYDPETVRVLSDAVLHAGNADLGGVLASQAQRMDRGAEDAWWEPFKNDEGGGSNTLTESMVYSCDAKLGKPTSIDCNLLSYSELGAPSDSITIGPAPGASKTLSSNNCKVAITSAITVTLTWAQIRAALDTLIDTCVADPFNAATGGVASAGPSQKVTVGVGHKRRRDSTINGLNALPPGVTITVSSN